MISILKFKLPEERAEFEDALKGSHYLCVIEELDNFLREKLKYAELSDEQYQVYETVRNKLREIRNDE